MAERRGSRGNPDSKNFGRREARLIKGVLPADRVERLLKGVAQRDVEMRRQLGILEDQPQQNLQERT